MNVVELLTEQACLRPDAPAIVDWQGGRERSLSFGELERRSRAVAGALIYSAVGARFSRRRVYLLCFVAVSAQSFVLAATPPFLMARDNVY